MTIDMQDISPTEKAKREILELIRRSAGEAEDPSLFIQELQEDIQEIPGAEVTFAGRSVAYLEELGYFTDRGDLTLEQKQDALFKASLGYGENSAAQDGITYEVDRVLDDRHPVEDSDMVLRPR